MTLLEDRPSARSARPRDDRFAVAAGSSWAVARSSWSDAERRGAATPFQSRIWLDAWYATHGRAEGFEPVPVRIEGERSGELAMLLPLVRRRHGGISTLEFADGEITDYNAPLLGPAAPTDRAGAMALWSALKAAFPQDDVIRFRKMPERIEGRANPLALLPQAHPCALNGNAVSIAGDWDDYHRGLEKPVRKELERSWRVFSKAEGAHFAEITNVTAAARVLAVMEQQQRARMAEAGKPYLLDDPQNQEFYRDLIANGLAGGHVVLTVLMAGEAVVAALLGVRRKDNYVMIRISNGGSEWSNCSPGRLVIYRTMAHLRAKGVVHFDFSLGNYAYKRRFGLSPLPLVDLVQPLSWRGLPMGARTGLVHGLRHYPRLDAFLRTMLGRPVYGEEPEPHRDAH